MKKSIFISIVGMLTYGHIMAQVLKTDSHAFRDGDEIVKQEVAYKSPGPGGKEAVWDFSDLSVVADAYVESYHADEGRHIMNNTPRAVYNYEISGDSLLCLGYSGENVQVTYFQPQLAMKFPVSYGDSVLVCHYGEGLYSKRLFLSVYGKTEKKADSYGILRLPDDVCLKNVLRVRETCTLGQRLSTNKGILCSDSLTAGESSNIENRLLADSVTWQTDTYRWYAEDCRYPVFETVEVDVLRANGRRIPHYRRSWYCHSADLDAVTCRTEGTDDIKMEGETSFNHVWSDGNRLLTVEFSTSQADGPAEVLLTTLQGIVLERRVTDVTSKGMHTEEFNLADLTPGVYIVSLKIKNETISEKILKSATIIQYTIKGRFMSR